MFVWFVGNLQQRPVFARAHVDLFSKHKPSSWIDHVYVSFNVFHLKGWVGGFLTRVRRKKNSSFPPCFLETFPTQKIFIRILVFLKRPHPSALMTGRCELSPVVKKDCWAGARTFFTFIFRNHIHVTFNFETFDLASIWVVCVCGLHALLWSGE